MSMSDVWKSMPPMRRMNLARGLINVAFTMTLFALIVGFDDDDDKTVAEKVRGIGRDTTFGFLFSDLIISLQVGNFLQSPIPAVQQVERLSKFVLADDKYKSVKGFWPFSMIESGKAITGFVSPAVKERREEREEQKRREKREAKELNNG
jgi:hypothetical protein